MYEGVCDRPDCRHVCSAIPRPTIENATEDVDSHERIVHADEPAPSPGHDTPPAPCATCGDADHTTAEHATPVDAIPTDLEQDRHLEPRCPQCGACGADLCASVSGRDHPARTRILVDADKGAIVVKLPKEHRVAPRWQAECYLCPADVGKGHWTDLRVRSFGAAQAGADLHNRMHHNG